MSSRKAIHNKPLQQSNVLLRILVRIFFKDYSEIDYFLRQQLLIQISSKISCARATKKHPFNIRLNSDDPMNRFLAKQHFIKDFLQNI